MKAKLSSSPVKSVSAVRPLRESALTLPVCRATARELAVTPMGLSSAALPASPSNSRPSRVAPWSCHPAAPLKTLFYWHSGGDDVL